MRTHRGYIGSASLKENYSTRKKLVEQRLLQERRLLAEATVVGELLLEALSKDELKQATDIIKKLGAFDGKIPSECVQLGEAVKKAMEEVRSFMGGGALKQMFTRGIGAVAKKLGIKVGENPLLKTLTLISSLEKAFAEIKDTVEKTAKDDVFTDENKNKFLEDAIGDNVITTNIIDIVTKALTPEGMFSKLSSLFGKGIPYVKDSKKMIVEIFKTAKVGEVVELIKILETGAQAEDAEKTVQQMAKDTADATGAPGKSGGGTAELPEKGQTIATPVQLVAAVAAGQAKQQGKNPEQVAQAATAAAEDPKAATQKLVTYLAKKSGQKDDVVKKVVAALLKSKKIVNKFEVTAESRRLPTAVTLTGIDVLRAVKCLNESMGSTARWVDLLCAGGKNPQKHLTEVRYAELEAALDVELGKGTLKSKDEVKKFLINRGAEENQAAGIINNKKTAKKIDDALEKSSGAGTKEGSEEKAKSTGGDKDGPHGGSEKAAAVANDLKKSLGELDVKVIKSVLDAIPEFLFPE